jgi:hypothetical protein
MGGIGTRRSFHNGPNFPPRLKYLYIFMTLDRVPGLALLVQLARTIRVSPFAFLGFRRLRETCRWTAVKERKGTEAVVVFVATAIGRPS